MPASGRFSPATILALAILFACSSNNNASGGSGGDYAPSSNASLSGNPSYNSVNIPAGVTVTVSNDMAMTVTGAVSVAGTLVASCHALSITAGGLVTITGTVRNDCATAGTTDPELDIIGESGYTLSGATITSSGDIFILDGPTHPQAAPPSGQRANSHAASAAAGFRCQMVNTTISTSPAKAANGADGVTDGKPGNPGHNKTSGCGQLLSGQTGGNLLIQGLQYFGGDGGNGGKGSSTTEAAAHGGAGGVAGGIAIVSDIDIVINGANDFFTGIGGDGGDASGAPTQPGQSATAVGGRGGDLQPKNYSSPLTIQAGGSLTINGALNLHLGHAGYGGDATATGVTGAPGQVGGNAASTGGDGGNSTPTKLLAAGAVSILGTVTITGGEGGNGGKATHSPGNGGAGVAAGASGGPGGSATGRGGNGGAGVDRPGGKGGDAIYTNGNGGHGVDNCSPPGQGGNGGDGGTAAGGDGTPGTGAVAGAKGVVNITDAFNGDSAGRGNPAGAGGKKGNNATAPIGVSTIVNSFNPGKDGNSCNGLLGLLVTPASQNVAEGALALAHANVTRPGSSTGNVTVVAKDPAGTVRGTAVIPPASSAADMALDVAVNAILGVETWTFTASAVGVAPVSQTINLNVSPVVGTIVSFQNHDPTKLLLFAATLNGNGGWGQRATFGNQFSAALDASTGGVTWVMQDLGTGAVSTDFLLDTPAGLAADLQTKSAASRPGVTVNGQTLNSNPTDITYATIGWSTVQTPPPLTPNGSATYTWLNVPAGNFTLFGSRTSPTSGAPIGFFKQNNVVVPPSGTLVIDFNSPTLRLPAQNATIAIGNLNGEQADVESDFTSTGGTSWAPMAKLPQSAATSRLIFGVQTSAEQPTDLNRAIATAHGTSTTRSVATYSHVFTGLSVTLPNAFSFNTACINRGSSVAIEVTGPILPGNSKLFTAYAGQIFGGKLRTQQVTATSDYLAGASGLDFVAPDLASINYDGANWGLQAATPLTVTLSQIQSSIAGAFRLPPTDGRIDLRSINQFSGQCP